MRIKLNYAIAPEHHHKMPPGDEAPEIWLDAHPQMGDVIEMTSSSFWAVKWRLWSRQPGQDHRLIVGLTPAEDPMTFDATAQHPPSTLTRQ